MTLCDAWAHRGVNVGSDHYLVRTTFELKLKQQRPLIITRPFAVEKLKDPVVANSFILELRNRLELLKNTNDIQESPADTKAVVNNCAEKVIGRRRGRRKEQWIQERTWRQTDERKGVKQTKKQDKMEEELKEENRKYAELDRMVKKLCRRDKKNWLMQKGMDAQEAASCWVSKTLYHNVSELTGARNMSNIPIKDRSGKPLMTVKEQDERWMQHFREVFNQPDVPETYNLTTKKNHSTNLTSTLMISVSRRRKLLLEFFGMEKCQVSMKSQRRRVVAEFWQI